MAVQWHTTLSKDAKKQYIKMRRSGQKRPSIIDIIDALVMDLNLNGPVLSGWPNYGIIHKSKKWLFYHCHLKKGTPTYVACWEVIDEKEKKIEVFYVGTHESAPY
jgi:hypothetical protein